MASISVIIATYGSEDWSDLARTRALPSVESQGDCDILLGHDPEGTLASVRNRLAQKALGEWLCFLDGDDELAPDYLGAMQRALKQEPERSLRDGLLLTPALSFVLRNWRHLAPHFQDEKPLRDGNWLTIGTLISKKMFVAVGGWREWPLYEDWDLWARCECRVVKVPDALYLAHYNNRSRNRTPRPHERNYWHQMIGHDLWPDYYDSPSGSEHQARQVAGVRKLALA